MSDITEIHEMTTYRLRPNPYVRFEGTPLGTVVDDPRNGVTVKFRLSDDSLPVYTSHYASTTIVGRTFFVRPEDLEALL